MRKRKLKLLSKWNIVHAEHSVVANEFPHLSLDTLTNNIPLIERASGHPLLLRNEVEHIHIRSEKGTSSS